MSEISRKIISITLRTRVCISISARCNHEKIRFVFAFLCDNLKLIFCDFINFCNLFASFNFDILSIFCKNFFKNSEHIVAIVRSREYSQIVFYFEWQAIFFKPFFAFFRSEFSQKIFEKIKTASIFGFENFFVKNPSRNITTATTRDNEFASEFGISFKQNNFEIIFVFAFK